VDVLRAELARIKQQKDALKLKLHEPLKGQADLQRLQAKYAAYQNSLSLGTTDKLMPKIKDSLI
jgi:hypothetical protein